MTKSLGMAVTAAALLAAPAMAADLPVKAQPIFAPAYNWSGWHAGGNVGYGWGNNTGDRWSSFVDAGTGLTGYFAAGGNVLPGVKPSGVIGGGQIGYDWQRASWVFGLVADLQGSDMHASASNTVTPTGLATSIQSNSAKIDMLGTVRGRVGYAVNNWLFYGTGGLAYGHIRSDVNFNCLNCLVPTIWSSSKSPVRGGWAAGAGMEYGLTAKWTVGIEYLHFDLGRLQATAVPNTAAAGASSLTARSLFAGDIVRGLVNYRF